MDDLRSTRRKAKLAWRRSLSLFAALGMVAAATYGQSNEVTVHIDFTTAAHSRHISTPASRAVVWLTPLAEAASAPQPHTYQMIQQNKRFDPHLLVIPVGSTVQFPNRDPFFHNVFSLFNGKRFDLGLYEAGSERGVHFDREGVSYIFCNIHPEMGAVILALSTPYYGVSSAENVVTIPHVPAGRYTLNVWSEGAIQASMNAARRQITVPSEGGSYDNISLIAAPSPLAHHSNKFGKSYPASPGDSSPDSPY
jgi:plastocyanin